MKIPNDLSQLKDKRALIITAGRQRARLYSIKNNEIREMDFIEIETPKYSDNEGFFSRSGKGKRYGAGAPRENNKQKIEADFLKELEKKLSGHLKKFDDLYLFCPNYMHKMIRATIPKDKKDMLKKVFFGNIVDTNPLKFVDKIETSFARRDAIKRRLNAKPEAKKILRKSRIARQVIKGKPSSISRKNI